jgi:RNA polymerase sigma-70 factor (ECF subfamily)
MRRINDQRMPIGSTRPNASHEHRGAALAAAVAELVAAARAAWPAIELPTDCFVAYFVARLPAGADPAAALRTVNAADLYLACACAYADPAALAAFDEHCLTAVDRALARLGLDADTIGEVKQRLRRALLVSEDGPPRIVGFAGRGALRSWVRVLAVHEAWAVLRARGRQPAGDDRLAEAASAGATPELEYLKRTYRRDFERAFRVAIQTVPARDRTLLRQHFLDGITINELGALYGVHRVTIGRWLAHARDGVLAATRAHLMQTLDVPRAEIESILRLVLSQIDLELRPLLAQRGT